MSLSLMRRMRREGYRTLYVPRAAVSIAGGIQPAILARVLRRGLDRLGVSPAIHPDHDLLTPEIAEETHAHIEAALARRGLIFGGRSVEHDVSVVTAHQIMRAFDRERYDVVPVYISRDGRWFSGEPLLDLKNFNDEVISLNGVSPVTLSPGTQHHGLIINPLAGRFSKSEIKRLDVAFPAVHGTHGEDGTLQGLLLRATFLAS